MGHGGLGRLFKENPTNQKKKEITIMNYGILAIENRINTLRGRGKENGRIVRKLERKLRHLKEQG